MSWDSPAVARAAFYCGEAAPPRFLRSRTVWVLLRVSLGVATKARIPSAELDQSDESVEMCGLPSQGRLFAAFRERWGRVATRGGVQAPRNPGPLDAQPSLQAETSSKTAGEYAQVGSAELVG